MNTQLLYILVSSPKDVYLEQAYLSALTARRHNPGARMLLLTDIPTRDGFGSRGPLDAEFRKLFDAEIAVDLDPSLPPMKRSRFLKTGMRNLVDGDFLFIDADTLVTGPLDEANGIEADLAACEDLHTPFATHPHRDATLSMCRKLGFDASAEESYFNSGVLFVRDTADNRIFFRRWQENYLKGYKEGIRPDQPSFAKTNAGLGHPVVRLEDRWNCEVQSGVRYLRDALIVHYMVTNIATGEEGKLFCLNDKDLLLRIRQEGIAPVEPVLEDPFKGYARSVRISVGDDLTFFRTRRYRWLRSHYQPGKKSLLEFLLKVRAHLLKTD